MRGFLLIFSAALLVFSCSSRRSDNNAELSLPPSASAPSNGAARGGGGGKDDASEKAEAKEPASPAVKKIIKNASIDFQVQSLSAAIANVSEQVKSDSGYIASQTESNYASQKRTTITIRVPAERFESLVQKLMTNSIYTRSSNIVAQDVTEQFVDIEARLKSKRALESRYLDLLKQTKSMTEILELEKQLASIREEIEAKEGVLKLLSNKVALSTITLNMHENIPYAEPPAPEKESLGSRLGHAFGMGWSLFVDALVGVSYLWVFIALGSLGVWLYRRYRKQKKEKPTR
jgi:hypothetical protein